MRVSRRSTVGTPRHACKRSRPLFSFRVPAASAIATQRLQRSPASVLSAPFPDLGPWPCARLPPSKPKSKAPPPHTQTESFNRSIHSTRIQSISALPAPAARASITKRRIRTQTHFHTTAHHTQPWTGGGRRTAGPASTRCWVCRVPARPTTSSGACLFLVVPRRDSA